MDVIKICITHNDNTIEEFTVNVNLNEIEKLLKTGERLYFTDNKWGVMIAISDCKRIEWNLINE